MQVRLTDAIIHLCAGGSIGKNSNTLSTSVYDNERCNDALVKVSVSVLVQVVTQMHYSALYMLIKNCTNAFKCLHLVTLVCIVHWPVCGMELIHSSSQEAV